MDSDSDSQDEEEEKVDDLPEQKMTVGTRLRSLTESNIAAQGQKYLSEKIIKKKNPLMNSFATPVFDEFLQAFIITRNDQSFYMDLNGNYDQNFRMI